MVMFGAFLFNLIPNPSSSFVRIAKSFSGLSTSRTMKMRLHVRATAMTCRPRPLPSFAPSMIPGKSRTCILAPLWLSVPGTVVRVVNSYEAASEWVPLKGESAGAAGNLEGENEGGGEMARTSIWT